MRLQRVGIWWLPTSWLSDDWLVTRQTQRFFMLSVVLVLALFPVFRGWVHTTEMSFGMRLAWTIVGVIGPIAIFFLWFGMWRYWVRIDNSSKWAKRTWFVILLLGFWWGSCVYCLFAYLPQVTKKRSD